MRRYTPRNVDDMVDAYSERETLESIARRFGTCHAQVARLLRARGVALRSRHTYRPKQEIDRKVAAKYAGGWSMQMVGDHYCMSESAVRKALLRTGTQIRSRREAWTHRRARA